jgi:energy-coupling factor transporter ATP-binding protein EcfA2
LAVLVGPSNHGKSSLFRSLKGVLRNDIPDEYVRNGQEEPLKVELELDGLNIKATRKRKGSTKYVLTPLPHKFHIGDDTKVLYDSEAEATAAAELLTPKGKVNLYQNKYSSLGGKVPDEVAKLGFGEVKIGEYLIDPIFSGQNKAQFLIDPDRWKPSEINAVLGAFSSTEKLDTGKKEANLRITQRKSEASTLATEIRSAEERSAKLLGITGEVTLIAEVVNQLEMAIRRDEGLVGQLGATLRHQARLEPLQGFLDALSLPNLTEIEAMTQLVVNLGNAGDALSTSRFITRLVNSLDSISDIWAEIGLNLKQSNGLAEITVEKKYSPEALDVAVLGVLNKVEEQFNEVKSLASSIQYMKVAIVAAKSYENLTVGLPEYEAHIGIADSEVETIRQELAEEAAAEAAKGLCPKCGHGLEHVCQ